MDISTRQEQLSQLESCLKDFNAEVTLILQSLQWDRKHLLEKKAMVVCQHNHNHRVPPDKLVDHEEKCFLKSQGYSEEDCLLPEPLDPDANTVVKLNTDNIADIIQYAAKCNPSIKRGPGCEGFPPLTVERLQASYTADERRVIHDTVVSRVPSCHDLSDLALPSLKDNEGEGENVPKSKLEILAELRNMKRRRTKYRVAAKTRNYSDVLRDVISTQMEMYTEAKENKFEEKTKIEGSKQNIDISEKPASNSDTATNNKDNERYRTKTIDKHREHDERESRKRKYDDRYDRHRQTSSHGYSDTSTTDRGKYRSHDERKREESSSRGEKNQRSSDSKKSDKKYVDEYISSEKHRSHKYHSHERSKSEKTYRRSNDRNVVTPARDNGNQIEERRKVKKERDTDHYSTSDKEYRTPARDNGNQMEERRKIKKERDTDHYSRSDKEYRHEKYKEKDKTYDKHVDTYRCKDGKVVVKYEEMERTEKYYYAEQSSSTYETQSDEVKFKRYYDDIGRSTERSHSSKSDKKELNSDEEIYKEKFYRK